MGLWAEKVPRRRKWQPTPVFLPGKDPMGRGAWRAIVHEVARVKYDVTAKRPPLDSKNCVDTPRIFSLICMLIPGDQIIVLPLIEEPNAVFKRHNEDSINVSTHG